LPAPAIGKDCTGGRYFSALAAASHAVACDDGRTSAKTHETARYRHFDRTANAPKSVKQLEKGQFALGGELRMPYIAQADALGPRLPSYLP
jgi:hypothetical protein